LPPDRETLEAQKSTSVDVERTPIQDIAWPFAHALFASPLTLLVIRRQQDSGEQGVRAFDWSDYVDD
jgi:hypothetical protein